MRLDLFVKLTYESSTIIFFVDITYYVRHLRSDLNNNAWLANRRYASYSLRHQLVLESCEFYAETIF